MCNNNEKSTSRNINICPIWLISIHTVEPEERKRNVLANNYTTTNNWYDCHNYTTITMMII